MNDDKILILYPPSNHHLGLWKDLEMDERVILRCCKKRELSRFHSIILRCLFHFKWKFLGKKLNHLRYEHHDIYKLTKKVSHLLIIDGALNKINITELERCRIINPKVQVSLYLINAIKAQSPTMIEVRKKMYDFEWDNIFSFDPKDSEEYGYQYLGFNYYSKPRVSHNKKVDNDLYFAGGLKGNRETMIFSVFNYLKRNGVEIEYDIDIMNSTKVTISDPAIHYFTTWRPYSEIIEKIEKSNCVLEIMQQGQSGATLRYFEAITMNKKLLTNNPNISSFPFYDSRWMHIFTSIDEIEIEWLQKYEKVDYHYNNDFSPTHLVDFLLK